MPMVGLSQPKEIRHDHAELADRTSCPDGYFDSDAGFGSYCLWWPAELIFRHLLGSFDCCAAFENCRGHL
jgi:hypothetical protein